jgi:hypothetical protein
MEGVDIDVITGYADAIEVPDYGFEESAELTDDKEARIDEYQ